MRKKYEISIGPEKLDLLPDCLVRQSENWEFFQLLHSNAYPGSEFSWIVALGCKQKVQPASRPFQRLRMLYDKNPDWLFGHFSYDLKNELEDLVSENPDSLGFPDLLFCIPEIVLYRKDNQLTLEYHQEDYSEGELQELINDVLSCKSKDDPGEDVQRVTLKPGLSKKEYLKAVKALKEHITYGNIYEVNFCQHYSGEGEKIDPRNLFLQLNPQTSAPFSAFYKSHSHYLLCFSPERYIKKSGNKVISQPMKGTVRRGCNTEEDEELKRALYRDAKERSENIMITDLVRNDLSKFALRGSVEVEELCGVKTFPTVHQLVSTISAEAKKETHWVDIIRHTFPMGSMTGAPKVKAMELIEEFENFKRGLYSGAVGYVTPEGDFDFNVVIRSILYNEKMATLAIMAGGAITRGSKPEMEYEESLLKLEALAKVLQSRL